MRLLSERGQYFPLTAMVLFSGIMLMVAGANVYTVAKAKLQVQNMADAAALAVAALEAKEINVIVDRNEWLNHMYPDDQPNNKNRLPNISNAAQWKAPDKNMAQYYAQLVATINKAQSMFMQAYERFMGADANSSATLGNSDAGALKDILSEIDGLNDPSVTVLVYNTSQDPQNVQRQAQAIAKSNLGGSSGGANIQTVPGGMKPIPIVPVDLIIADDGGGNKNVTLSKVLKLPQDGKSKIGWMRPDWDNAGITSPGQSKKVIGAGVVVVKRVPRMFQLPLFRVVDVTARSTAYVVQESGLSVDKSGSSVGGPASPPKNFIPTYYVKLGTPS